MIVPQWGSSLRPNSGRATHPQSPVSALWRFSVVRTHVAFESMGSQPTSEAAQHRHDLGYPARQERPSPAVQPSPAMLRCGISEPAIRRVCEINTMMNDGIAGLSLQHLNSGAKGSSGLKFNLIKNVGIGRHTRSERRLRGSRSRPLQVSYTSKMRRHLRTR